MSFTEKANFIWSVADLLRDDFKEDTFILDFVNSAEDIQAAFSPYYEESLITETTDANIVYDLKAKLDGFRVYWDRG